ncbi:hypothetical protein Q3G72_013650 [Acer saccharum]|nr:hypothetical protein Q3G72_013650 [Acer saccharum]
MSLWYRPSEVMLFSHNYSYPVDLWAMGAIMAELLMLRPLFPGRNASDQMSVMCRVLGSPTTETWPEGLALAKGWKLELSIPTVFGCASLVVDAIHFNDNSMSITTLDDDDDQVPNKNDKILENPIGESKYGPVGEEERVLASSVESSLKLSQETYYNY